MTHAKNAGKGQYNKRDRFHQAAKEQGFAARSVFKLAQMDERHRIFKSRMRILDFGAAPGSWMQYMADKVGALGEVVGFDLEGLSIALPAQVRFIQCDILTLTPEIMHHTHSAAPQTFDVVVSDLAPKTTGIKIADRARSLELVAHVWELAQIALKPGGAFVFKLFYSNDFEPLLKALRQHFAQVTGQRPDAVRDTSEERYFVCTGLKAKL